MSESLVKVRVRNRITTIKMSNSTMNFKVYCVSGNVNEVKRFFLDTGAVTSFVYIQQKLEHVFPNLVNTDYRITWKDGDGDFISITNDDDLITALTEMQDNPKVLFVNVETRNMSEANQRQFRVLCDICEKGISGYRYKCIECPDFDLCATCEGFGHHSDHMVLRLPNSNTSIPKLDRKMMYNAARALKKSAFTAAKEAHRCARESFRGGEKEKSNHHEGQGSSTQNPNYQCPFATADIGDLISQNMSPLLEAFSKGSNQQEENVPNPISDLVRSVAEAFTGLVNSVPNTQAATNTSPPESQPKTTAEDKIKQTNTENASKHVHFPREKAPSAPEFSAVDKNISSENRDGIQEMEWTLVSDSEESVPQVGRGSQEQRSQPPPLPQDPRLMRGLAQLYEMGFSNENQFLNYMLESHNYNVGDVVKAILELK